MAIQPSVDNLFDSYAVDALAEIAYACGIVRRQTKRPLKQDLIDVLKAQLFLGERVKTAYAALADDERQVLQYLLFRGGELKRGVLERELVRAKVVAPIEKIEGKRRMVESPLYAEGERMARVSPESTALQDILARLTLRGLVFSRQPASEYGSPNYTYKFGLHPGAVIFVPADVRSALPAVTTSPVAVKAWEPARTTHQLPYVLLRDLFLYWDFVRRNEPPLLRSGYVGKRTLRAINELLIEPDPTVDRATDERDTKRLALLRRLLAELKLVDARNDKLVALFDADGALPAFWAMDIHQQVAALLRMSIGDPTQQTPTPKMPFAWYFDDRGGRVELLKALLQAGSQWQEVVTIVERARQNNRGFLVPALNTLSASTRYVSAHIGGRYYNNTDTLLEAIEKEEEQFAIEFCSGLLFSYGMFEHGYLQAHDKQWKLVRLTPIGLHVVTAALGLGAQAAPVQAAEAGAPYVTAGDDQGRVVVQPNFQVLAMGPVSTHILARLELCASRTKADAHVFEYALTRESVYQAQQADFTVDAVIGFLEEASGAPLPQNVLRSLQEWGAHHDRIVFRTGVSLLQATDADALARLMADSAINPYLARGIGPAVALVGKGAQTDLLAALRGQGLLPAMADADPRRTDNDVTIQPDGQIVPVHSVPSLFLTGRLAHVAEQDADGAWRVTAAAVNKTGGGRSATIAMLAELEKLNRGVLPETLVADIKRWGGYYGQATIATVTFLEFESKAQLADVLAQPAMQGRLTPFAAGERALATTPTDQLAAVAQLLAELGVTIV